MIDIEKIHTIILKFAKDYVAMNMRVCLVKKILQFKDKSSNDTTISKTLISLKKRSSNECKNERRLEKRWFHWKSIQFIASTYTLSIFWRLNEFELLFSVTREQNCKKNFNVFSISSKSSTSIELNWRNLQLLIDVSTRQIRLRFRNRNLSLSLTSTTISMKISNACVMRHTHERIIRF
jgi:hypothetical protein